MAQNGTVVLALATEDGSEVVSTLQARLEAAGYIAVPAADGLQALLALESLHADALVVTPDLPVISGLRVLRVMKNQPAWKDIPVLIASRLDFEEVEYLLDEGVNAFGNPSDPKDLVERLDFVLERGKWADASGTSAGEPLSNAATLTKR